MTMMNFLAQAGVLGGKGQAQPTYSAQQEAEAQKAGFQSYAQMRQFLINRSQANHGEGPPAIQGATPAQSAPPGPNNAMSWHPRTIMDWVAQKINGAMN